jgi:hypothetical protein
MVQSQGEVPGAAAVAPQAGVGGGGAGGVTSTVPVLEPVARLELPTTASGQVIFGSVEVDGANRLVYVRHPDVSGWLDRVSWYAPEAALVGIFVAVVAVVAALLRMRRWPRRAGRVYCAACNYELDGVEVGGRCPECGVPEARRVKGRGGLRRFGPVLAIAAVVMVVGMGVLVMRIERATGGMATGREWPMPALGRWVPALRLVKREPEFAGLGQLLVYSMDTGERVARLGAGGGGIVQDLVIAEDGNSIAVGLFETGLIDGGYQTRVATVERIGAGGSGPPRVVMSDPVLSASDGAPEGEMTVGLGPIHLSPPSASDGSRWLYYQRFLVPTLTELAVGRAQLLRVRINGTERQGAPDLLAECNVKISLLEVGNRLVPYTKWLIHSDDPSEREGPVRAVLFVDVPPPSPATGTRDAKVVAFMVPGLFEKVDGPAIGREIAVSYAGSSFYASRLAEAGRVLEFESYGGSGTVRVDLESGTTTLLATGTQGHVLVIGHLGWRMVLGRSVVGPDGATVAALGGVRIMSMPSALSQDGRFAAGFDHGVTGVGWWNQLGIGPWNQGEVVIWDLSQVPGWRGR